jgi:TolB-like protein
MGVVYKAEDTRLHRRVALKLLPPELARDAGAKRRLFREARAISSLQHDNICTIHELGETDAGQLFICMDYYDGETLRERLERGRLETAEAIDVVIQLCAGLGEAHRHGIIHRDIKPANVMVTKNGVAKILDFGLAKAAGHSKVTKTGTTVGTAAYMSPEQVRGEELDARSDIFSLGVLFYELLVGTDPFAAEHEPAVMHKIMCMEPPPLRGSTVEHGAQLDIVIRGMLAKEPQDRYESTDEVIAALRGLEKLRHAGRGKRAWLSASKRTPTYGVMAAVLAVVGIVASYFWLVAPGRHGGSAPGQKGAIIAVLPFANISMDESREYFADGMTEEVINRLAQVRSIRVISRTSSMRYKGRDAKVPDIAAELGATTVLEGAIRSDGDQLWVSVQLIEAKTDRTIWAHRYEGLAREVLEVQQRISFAVAEQIVANLSVNDRERLQQIPTTSIDAYNAYLQGRHLWNKRTAETLRKAIEMFDKAIDIDPNFAAAYAAAGASYVALGTYDYFAPPRELASKAEEMTRKALDLDPESAEAHAAMGSIAAEHRWDWETATAHFERSLELNPSGATTRQWFAEMLRGRGRVRESMQQMTIARQLDPLSLIIPVSAALDYALVGDSTTAMGLIEGALNLDPHFIPAYGVKSMVYLMLGRESEAARNHLKSLEMGSALAVVGFDIPTLRAVLDDQGPQAYYLEIATGLRRVRDSRYVSPAMIGCYFAAAGQADSAMVWLERGYQLRDQRLAVMAVNPFTRTLRHDPRFIELADRIGVFVFP